MLVSSYRSNKIIHMLFLNSNFQFNFRRNKMTIPSIMSSRKTIRSRGLPSMYDSGERKLAPGSSQSDMNRDPEINIHAYGTHKARETLSTLFFWSM